MKNLIKKVILQELCIKKEIHILDLIFRIRSVDPEIDSQFIRDIIKEMSLKKQIGFSRDFKSIKRI